MDCFTFYCLPGLVPGPRLGKQGLVKCHMSASQVLNAPTCYTTLTANDALPDPTFCNQCKPWKPIAFHRCRSRQILRGAKDFAQISRNMPEKNSIGNDLKKWLHFIAFWAHFFEIIALQAPFLPKFPPNLPKFLLNCPKKNWRNMTSKKKKNVCTLISGAIFVKSKHIKRFCEGFHTFCSNLHRFCLDFKRFFPDFHHIKNFGGGLPPPSPPPPTPLVFNLLLKTFMQLVWMPEKAVLPQTHLIRFACNVRIQRSHPWRRLTLKFGILQ